MLAGVHWSRNEHLDALWSITYGRPIFRTAMSNNRMSSLLPLCTSDDKAARHTRMHVNKMAPINEFWTLFLAQLQTCFAPGGFMRVNEQVIPTRDHCKFY